MKATLIFATLLALPTLSFADTTYTVRAGDTLLNIADRGLNATGEKKDPRRYEIARKIRAKNPQLKNPNSLNPGDTLTLPDMPHPMVANAGAAAVVKQKASVHATAHAELPTPTPAEHPPVEPPVPPTPVVTNTPPPPAPKPVPEVEPLPPTPPPHQAEAHGGDHHDFIGLQPRFRMVTLKTTDLIAEKEYTMKSKSSAGIDLNYAKVLNEQAHLLLSLGFTYTEFKDIDNGATINHTRESQKAFNIGFAYDILPTLHFDLLLGAADRTFVIPTALDTFELKSLLIPGGELNLSWDFVQTNTYAVGVSAIGEYMASLNKDNVEYKSSFEPMGALYWTSRNGHDQVNYKVSVVYKNGHQKTNLTEQKEELITAGLLVNFPL